MAGRKLGNVILLPLSVLALAACQAQLVIPNNGQASLGVVSAGNAKAFGATTPVPLYFATSTFALSNQSLKGATQVSLSFSDNSVIFEGGSYPGTGGTCGTFLGPNSTCTIIAIRRRSYRETNFKLLRRGHRANGNHSDRDEKFTRCDSNSEIYDSGATVTYRSRRRE